MKVSVLIQKHKTRNPYTIARSEGITLIFEELGTVYGYYNKVNDSKFIHINDNVPEYFQRYIVAHLLYPAINDLEDLQFIKKKTAYKYLDVEKAANKFAIELTMDVEELKQLGSYTELMKRYGMDESNIQNLYARLKQVLKSDDGIETLLDAVINDFRKDV